MISEIQNRIELEEENIEKLVELPGKRRYSTSDGNDPNRSE